MSQTFHFIPESCGVDAKATVVYMLSKPIIAKVTDLLLMMTLKYLHSLEPS